MIIEQLYTGCLAQGAYYIESAGEAAIIDPLRETSPYIRKAEKSGATIKYVFETHFHADFVSGHVDLAQKTGASIVYGPNANTTYEALHAKDGDVFKLGDVTIKVLHTPGHTLESTTYLLIDESGRDHAIFTGDTLFIGDVGRPDLAIKGDLNERDLAGMLYDSLQAKIMPLADAVIVYPAHGAGSACGKNMSKETTDSLGNQKRFNYALRAASKADFVEKVLDGLSTAPAYFAENARLNKEGYEPIDTVMKRGSQALAPEAFEGAVNETGALVLDVRDAAEFAHGFIPNAINIGLNGQFAPWVGALIPDLLQPIALVTPAGQESETVLRLARVGYDHCIGFLEGGFVAWKQAGKEVDTVETISAADFAHRWETNPALAVVDVRKPAEYEPEHVEGAKNMPLDTISDHMHEIQRNEPIYVHCAGGYRSMVANSILKARGFQNVVNVEGGMAAIKKTSVPVVQTTDVH
ncbi:MBL fold metallo-hydrolase [Spirosoma utsteinense]|uniref:Glyoxylase-like metal-dependent hydrolase (Beta-lactamase superfamily II) n=1 Tax=Spirosoma utsteinense TaxID=2585773 RepID=A0ABR6W2J5_9BACT|nr:MBL fold metallo-hydrolase [Spirosoma utsteinense]MBC3783735.1 glyoxylase-like metal-dependent hydrolase/rhodanese-related sulfurtransferase [Spirosoma utsteinense]MBC3790122.1 glyoxylase-like metal-dependent hydrolase (beta-lactamase superfamily II) [Spirosoma utsteinense]